MIMRTGVRLTKTDIIEYAEKTIDIIVQVARVNGKRGVLQIVIQNGGNMAG